MPFTDSNMNEESSSSSAVTLRGNAARALFIGLWAVIATVSCPAAVRHFDGSSSTSWAVPANWSNNLAVSANDNLIFPTTALNKTNNNTFSSGTVFSQLCLTDDYVLNGNSIDLTNGQFQFQGMGEVGLSYLVQASTNLSVSNWVNLGSVSANGAGLFQFIDTNALNSPCTFTARCRRENLSIEKTAHETIL